MGPGQDTRLAGYRILSLLGRGGTGSVYLADDLRLDRKVALKILNPEIADAPEIRSRFVAESRTAASLDHPHILPIYEAGEADGRLYIAMRYVQGRDLAGLIDRDHQLPLDRAVRVVSQLAGALDAAHDAGLIHRDVKPGNVLLASGAERGADHVYLSDFGLTKRVGYGQSATKTGQVLGTVGYIAPEQIEGRPIDRRVDVYSLGCIAYECLAGAAPFARDTDMAVLMAHLQVPPPSLLGTRPELPPAVDAVITRALAKEPDDRFSTAGELAAALATAATPEAGATAITRGFLFADLRGYTEFVEGHGDRTAVRLLDAYRQIVRDVARRFGGAEIKTEGDSFYLVFPSASQAVACGLAITSAAAAATERDPDLPVRVGIGVHAGESAAGSEGPVGLAVNTAARICSQAQAGELLVSETVRALTRSSGDFAFTPRGRRQLKGIAEPVALYAVGSALAGAGQLATARGSTGLGSLSVRRRRTVAIAAVGGVGVVAFAAAVAFGPLGSGNVASPSPSGPGEPGGAVLSPSASATKDVIAYGVSEELRGDLFCQDNPGDSRIYLTDANGTTTTRLIAVAEALQYDPVWSSDGTRIAFRGVDQYGQSRIWTVRPDGSDARALPGAQGQIYGLPVWSPDGRKIFFGTTFGATSIYAQAADGSDEPKILIPAYLAEGSPAPTPPPGLKDVPSSVGQIGLIPAGFLPDGHLAVIAVGSTKSALDPHRLRQADPDGTGLRVIPGFPDLPVRAVAWSPDGKRVALEVVPDPGTIPGSSARDAGIPRIYVGAADGSGLMDITPAGPNSQIMSAESPAWSPDGTQIAYLSGGRRSIDVFVMNADGSNAHAVSDLPSDQAACHPSWGRTTEPISTPAPSLAAGATPWVQAYQIGRLEPGEYEVTKFQPGFRFRVGEGWRARVNAVDNVELRTTVASSDPTKPEGTTGTILIGQIRVINTTPCINSPTELVGSSPGALITALQKNAYLTAGTPVPVVVGGKAGLAVDIAWKKAPSAATCPNDLPGVVWLFPVGQDQGFKIRQGEKARLTVLDVNGTSVTFVESAQQTDWNAFLTVAQPVIDSLAFP